MTNILRGILRQRIHVNDQSTWSVVIMDDPQGNAAKCTGPVPYDGWKKGQEYVLAGQWVDTLNHGRQFQFKSVAEALPVTPEGIKSYLAKVCTGVGGKIADKIYHAFGNESCEILRTNPKRVSDEIQGLSQAKAEQIQKELQDAHLTENVNIQLSSLLDGYGFRNSVYNAVYSEWGMEAANRIRRNPFCMLKNNIPSVGFRRVDQLYCDLYRQNEKRMVSVQRQALAGWWCMKSDSTGNAWMYEFHLRNGIIEQTKPNDQKYEFDKVMTFLRRSRYAYTREHEGKMYVTDSKKFWTEHRVAQMIAYKMVHSTPWDIEIKSGRLSPHQLRNAQLCIAGPIGILCGTPGTGKTFTSAEMIRNLLTQGYRVRIAAPTGKAAVRCTAAMDALGIQLKATTIHTLLEPYFDNKGKMHFGVNKENQLDCDVVVIDEASMLDMPLFYALLQSIPLNTKLILVGDQYQLPPVGWGQPLTDLLTHSGAIGIGVGELTEIYRNCGGIVKACQRVKNGQVPKFAEKFDPADPDTNCIFMECKSEEGIIVRLDNLLTAMMARGDSLSDIQVIVATNDMKTRVNSLIQSKFNFKQHPTAGNRFRVDDKAIILRNKRIKGVDGHCHWQQIDDLPDGYNVYVANGDVGRVIQVGPNSTYIQLDNPERTVLTGAAKEQTDEPKRKDRLAEPLRSEDSAPQVDLAYAITGHKSQGSGYKYVIILLEPGFGAAQVMSRQWFYTALSRGEEITICIGMNKTVFEVVQKVSNQRITFLPNKILDMINENVQELTDGTDAQDDLEVPVCDPV